MEFDPNAKANTVSAALNTLKWGVWCAAGFFVFVLAVSYPAEDPNGYYSVFIFGVGIAGYYIGHFIQKYHDSILKGAKIETNEVEEDGFSLSSVDGFLASATDDDKRQIDEAWTAPKDNTPVNGETLNDAGLKFMREAYRRNISAHDKRRILLSLYSGAPIGVLYDMLPETKSRKKIQ